MAVSRRVQEFMESASWIRRMFEQGAELKREHGAENVFDFSLGNPDLEPPEAFYRVLRELIEERSPHKHCYMQNAGYPQTRARTAERVKARHGVDPRPEGILMTVGAAGALNTCFKALLDPDSEVICTTPYFPEYRFYVDNHGGKLILVPTTPRFDLDLAAIEAAITPLTRAVIINSPNNPTGRIYDQESLDGLGKLLEAKAPDATVISDEPYWRIVYEGARPGSVFQATPRSVIATSFSKDLGLAGERIGFLAVHPEHPDRRSLLGAAVFSNRTLGYVNAPALMQRVVTRLEDVTVDLEEYSGRRRLFLDGLRDAGYDCVTPEGAFYLFPRAPIDDDVAFIRELLKERILAVPGTGFGTPGHFRLSYAIPRSTIKRALPGFKRVMERLKT